MRVRPTPGPWHSDGERVLTMTGKERLVANIYAPGVLYADDGSGADPNAYFEVVAENARLIAAAPEMLELLRVLLTATEHSPGEDIERDEIVSEGRALLARIDGKDGEG